MTVATKTVVSQALALSPTERAEVLEALFASFDSQGDSDIAQSWANEAEGRLDAYERGELRAVPAEEVFARIDKD